MVAQVLRESPAALAGMSIGDEITAIDGRPLMAGQLAASLERLRPGSPIAVSVLRRGELRVFHIVLAADPGHGWALSVSPAQSSEQRRHMESWLQ
jgi:regulator of sigma E protease